MKKQKNEKTELAAHKQCEPTRFDGTRRDPNEILFGDFVYFVKKMKTGRVLAFGEIVACVARTDGTTAYMVKTRFADTAFMAQRTEIFVNFRDAEKAWSNGDEN